MRESWRQVRAVVEEFWRRWSKEYVTNLQKRMKWTSSSETPKIDRIVPIMDNCIPREKWQWGVVVEHLGDDPNHIRRVKLRLANGTFLERHVSKIVPLELD